MTGKSYATGRTSIDKIRPFLFIAFFISGANGLIFEIIFRRLLHLSLGVTHYSVGIVLTVFMAGLGIGSLIFGKIADRTPKLLLIYGLLEAGIGVLGIILIGLSGYLDSIYVFFLRMAGSPESANIITKTMMAGILLLPMTILMGGTLPVLGKTLSSPEGKSGAPLGLLYGLNTLGGVVGTLGVTFALLGAFGTSMTMLLFSLISIGIGAVALFFYRATISEMQAGIYNKPADKEMQAGIINKPAAKEYVKKNIPGADRVILPLIAFFISGFVGLSVEVYWTRILAYVIGSHGYAFGIILAAFLSGLGLGSVIMSRVVDRVRHPVTWLGILLIFIGMTVLISSLLLFEVGGLAGRLTIRSEGSWPRFIISQMVILFCILILPTLLMGSIFPFVMSVLTGNYKKLGGRIGRAYSINTLGSIIGAFMGSFILIRYTGISSSLKISILVSAAAGLAIVFFSRERVHARTAGLIGGIAAIVIVFFVPMGHPLQKLGPGDRLIFNKEGSSATVTVREDAEGGRMLSINGLDEVPVDPSSLLTFRVLAHLPLLLHPGPRDVMVLSLGGGITTGSVATHDLKTIDVVELCPPVVQAAELFEHWNHGVLNDPRLNIIIQDGRNYLLLTDKRYDVITADATHPWSADSWILYTGEFYEMVLSHLRNGGIFCQWVPLHYLSQDDFKCILRTMRTVFPYLSIWYTGSYVVVTGSKDSIAADVEIIERRMTIPGIRDDLKSVGIDSPYLLFSLYLMSGDTIDRFVGNGPLNTDNKAYLEHSAARCFGRETTPENLLALKNSRENLIDYFKNRAGLKNIKTDGMLNELAAARESMIMGRISTYGGNFSGSIEYYRNALRHAPEDQISRIFFDDAVRTYAAHWANEGDDLRRKGLIEEAVEAYEKALKLDPSDPRAHNGIGLLLYNRGRYREALYRFTISLDRMPYQVQIRYNRVLALLKLKMVEEAQKEIEEIEQLEKGMNMEVSKELRKYLYQIKFGKK